MAIAKKKTVKKMTEKELQDWDALYQYVKDLMGYDKKQSLSSTMVLRLKGLLTNKFMENNSVKSTAEYSFETILYTFKYCSPEIQKALMTNQFNDEQHRFNYILRLVERNINTVYMRMKAVEKSKEEAKTTSTEVIKHIGAEYQKKSKETSNKKLEELW